MSKEHKFEGISYKNSDFKSKGILELSPTKISFSSNNASMNTAPEKIKLFDYEFTTRGYVLRVHKSKEFFEFVGFKKPELQRLVQAIQGLYPQSECKEIKLSTKGYNWGNLGFNQTKTHLRFATMDTDEQLFDIPVDLIKNCSKQPKTNELVLELTEDQSALERRASISQNDDCLVELRFTFPKDSENEDVITVENMYKQIVKGADIIPEEGDSIANLPQLPFVTPRGRYTVDLYSKFMRLHGKTHNFKIPYNTISTMFLLPKPDQLNMYFVISLETPIRIGKTHHNHLVFMFNKNTSFSNDDPLKLRIKKEELKKYPGITEKMTGRTFEVVAKIFRAFTSRKLIGSGSYQSSEGQKGIKCSVKANEGYLFFLEKSIFFLHKPPIYLRHDEIKSFKLQRADQHPGISRSFDLVVLLRNGKSQIFSNIMKAEQDILINFLQKKNLSVEGLPEAEKAVDISAPAHIEDDEEDDEDFVAEEDSEDDDEEFEENVSSADIQEVDTTGNVSAGEKRKRSEGSPPKNSKQKTSQ